MTRTALKALLLAVLALALVSASAQAATSPRWQLQVFGQPTNFDPASNEDTYTIIATNAGTGATKGLEEPTIVDTLPAGVEATGIEFFGPNEPSGGTSSCTISPVVKCEYSGTVPAALGMEMAIHVKVQEGAQGPLVDVAAISGGGAGTVSATSPPNQVSSSFPAFGFQAVEAGAHNTDSSLNTQAGGHPFSFTVSGYFNTRLDPLAEEERPGQPLSFPVEEPKLISVQLPPGLIANPHAIPTCALADFFTGHCSPDDQIGTITITEDVNREGNISYPFDRADLYNLDPEFGHAANIGFLAVAGVPFILTSGINTGGDYSVVTNNEPPGVLLSSFSLELWGVPADPSHNGMRGMECSRVEQIACIQRTPRTSSAPLKPFLRLPTSCPSAQLQAHARTESWENPGVFADATAPMAASDGCNAVPFEPSIQARPTTNLPDAPSGLEADVHVAQNEAPEGVGSADVRDTVVSLPAGMRLNPSAANGRQGCTEAQIELHGPNLPTCPNASKLGTVEVDTPLQGHPLPGSVYLATPHQNPFGSLLALYAVVEDPVSGVIVKLPGKVEANGQTGQLTTSFEESPQLPFEDFHLRLFGGALGSLRTPSVCGTYKSTSVLTPWSAPESGPPAEPSDEFAIGGACAQSEAAEPNAPAFHAGTEAPQAGKFSPFAFKLTREDGTQELSKIETTMPPGLTGKLAGVPYCPEAAIAQAKGREHDGGGTEELASPSCPQASEVGAVSVGAGAGPDPYYTSGHAYLAGPYAGAPVSLVTIVPAVAGPFDLGTVVTRIALHVDPFTTQIHAISDPLPQIIDGIPLDVRSITLKLDRPSFTLNPTSCNPMAIGGSATSVFGQATSLAQRFQVGGCNALAFKPKLAISLKGKIKRSGFPALRATLKMKPGEANVAAAQVTLPHAAFLANAHIDKTCGHPELLAHSCPATSIYGHAKAWSPLLDKPLEGNVYLVTGFGYELPALVADLQGQIEVDLVGKVDTGREDGIRNTFEMVPDAPVSKFVLEMAGGKKGLIELSEPLCAKHTKRKALAEFTAQNGKVRDFEPVVQAACGHSRKAHGGHKHKKRTG